MNLWVQAPVYGKQRDGYPPGGPADRFSAAIANALVGNAGIEKSISILRSRGELLAEQDMTIAFSGAPLYINAKNSAQGTQCLHNNCSHDIMAGTTISWEPIKDSLGFRSYLAVHGGFDNPGVNSEQLIRKDWEDISSWCPPSQVIRILPGPESNQATHDYLCNNKWIISRQSNNQGLRLQSHCTAPTMESIISAPVLDGTVQLTPDGPIVLMRERQTVGGYPRIAQVISCDMDMLAQYRAGQQFQFSTVTIEEAKQLEQRQIDCKINAIKKGP